MPQLNPAQARMIDPVLSTVARGYTNAEMVAQYLFPFVPVDARGGKIIEFGKEGFRLYASQRAPGESTKRVKFGYAGAPFALNDFSLEGQVPFELDEESQAIPGIDMGSQAVNGVQAIMLLGLEKTAADLARNAANYAASNKVTLLAGDQWNDAASDPIEDVSNARDAIRATTGKRPNTMILGAPVMTALKRHPKIIDRIKYTGRDVPTAELLASMFEVKRVVVGEAIYADDAGNFADVWGKDVVLGYTELGSKDAGVPTYGYTYQLRSYPVVEQSYADRNAKSWIYPVTRVEAPVIASALAGYVIKAAVA